MRVSIAIAFIAAAGLWLGLPSSAAARAPELGRSCAPAIERYCPELSGTTQTRNQMICLRPYRLNTALPCRRALARLKRRS